jgi:thiamine pyrophosphate-dependent acetolactate synthase large subunit-like protein
VRQAAASTSSLAPLRRSSANRPAARSWSKTGRAGAEGIRVTDPNAVEGALRQGLAATKNKPALVEVMVADRPYPKI